jgi:magnesium transporter
MTYHETMPREERQREWEERVRASLSDQDRETLAALLADVHSADLAELFAELDEPEQRAILEAIDDEQAADLLGELDIEEQAEALDLLTVDRTSDILEEMPSDEAADLLAELPVAEADALLERMEPELVDEVIDLLRYPEDTAGGLMAKEYVGVTPDETVAQVLDQLRLHLPDAEMIYQLYVVDEDERLLGEVSLRQLIVAEPESTMADIMLREFASVTTDQPQEEVAELVRRRDLFAVPVLDTEGRMQGIITVDDIGYVVQEEAAEDLLEISGTAEPEETQLPWTGWRSSMWALVGGVVIALLILAFAGKLVAQTQAATFLPLVLVLGITLVSQTALSMDRAYKSAVERHQLGRIVLRELFTGAALAGIAAVITGILTFALQQHLDRALVIAIAIALGLWVASLIGTLGALLMRKNDLSMGPTAHTILIGLALLVGVSIYLLMAIRG